MRVTKPASWSLLFITVVSIRFRILYLFSVPYLHRTGVFVGGDALYCCLEHPDRGLRSNLTLSCPLNRG